MLSSIITLDSVFHCHIFIFVLGRLRINANTGTYILYIVYCNISFHSKTLRGLYMYYMGVGIMYIPSLQIQFTCKGCRGNFGVSTIFVNPDLRVKQTSV